MTAAAWWDNPQDKTDTPVVRHAPDQHNYHLPDGTQLDKMRGSKVGGFAIIPASYNNGRSKGFDPTTAGVVHVDPDAPDGGVIFDPNSVRKKQLDNAVNHAEYPHQVFYALGVSATSLGLGTPKQAAVARANGFDVHAGPNPHMPNTYVTPSVSVSHYPMQEQGSMQSIPPISSLPPIQQPQTIQQAQPTTVPASQLTGTQEMQPVQQQPVYYQQPLPQPQQGYYQQQVPQYVPPQQYAQPQYTPPPLDPTMQSMMRMMTDMQHVVNGLAAKVNQQEAQLPPTTGLSRNPLPVGKPLATLPVETRNARASSFDDTARSIRQRRRKEEDDEDEEVQAKPRRSKQDNEDDEVSDVQRVREYNAPPQPDGVIIGFETLGLKFVTGPIAHKATKQVVFEIPNAGKHMTRFHDVIDAKDCIVLVYDTRYEDGNQYVPPEIDPSMKIVVHVGSKNNLKSYEVASLGLNYSFGVFDHIVLVKTPDSSVEYGEES